MSNPVGDLFYRLSGAVGGHDVDPEERDKIIAAWTAAGGQEMATWDKLPLGIQHLIKQIEDRPQQSWDDPADLPDQKNL